MYCSYISHTRYGSHEGCYMHSSRGHKYKTICQKAIRIHYNAVLMFNTNTLLYDDKDDKEGRFGFFFGGGGEGWSVCKDVAFKPQSQ